MSVESIIALIGLANSLINVVEKEREILRQNGEWTDAQEGAYNKARADAGSDPDMQPETSL